MTPTPHLEIEEDLSTTLIQARNGNQEAWEKLFKECYPKVLRVVRRRLNRSLRTIFDSTDFANETMQELAAHLHQLDFPTVGSLVKFLAKVAEQKLIDEHRRQRAGKRDIALVRSLSGGAGDEGEEYLLPSPQPTASKIAQANEVHERLLERSDETERRMIELRRQGHTTQDIAQLTGWNIRKVQRFFQDLRDSLAESGD